MRKTIEANVWVKIFHGDLLQVSDEVYKQNIASNKLLAKLLCVKCLTKTLSCIAAFKFHKDEHKIRLALPLRIDRLSLNSSVICNCPLRYYQQSTSLLVLLLLTLPCHWHREIRLPGNTCDLDKPYSWRKTFWIRIPNISAIW